MSEPFGWKISEDSLRHIYNEHKDLINALNIKDITELRELITSILQDPDELYTDKHKTDVKYHLKTRNHEWILVITSSNVLKTAYLISSRTYKRFREKRWR